VTEQEPTTTGTTTDQFVIERESPEQRLETLIEGGRCTVCGTPVEKTVSAYEKHLADYREQIEGQIRVTLLHKLVTKNPEMADPATADDGIMGAPDDEAREFFQSAKANGAQILGVDPVVMHRIYFDYLNGTDDSGR
jgi:hypothetical protein